MRVVPFKAQSDLKWGAPLSVGIGYKKLKTGYDTMKVWIVFRWLYQWGFCLPSVIPVTFTVLLNMHFFFVDWVYL